MIFITGGVRSGKSSYAEKRAISLYKKRTNVTIHYVATSYVYDAEMEKRVDAHARARKKSGICWTVWEQQTNIAQIERNFNEGDVVLLDCVTTLLSNELFQCTDDNEPKWIQPSFVRKVETKMNDLINEWVHALYTVILVSNEVGYDVYYDSSTELYRRLLGRIHEQIVRVATEAIVVESGIPCWKKGNEQCMEL